jgi:opacity protein-like surface antigen
MGGLTSISNPEINITFSNNTWLKQISTDASGFGYLIGAGVKYNLSEKWCLIGNIDYTGASIDFKDVTTTYSNGFIQKSSNTLTFASVNSTIGIGLRF